MCTYLNAMCTYFNAINSANLREFHFKVQKHISIMNNLKIVFLKDVFDF